MARLLGQSSPEDETLCEELGLLPLALMQACAYIRSQGLTTAQYLEQLKTAPSLLEQNTELFGKELPKAVGALWQITLKKLEEEAPNSLRLLKQLSYLSPEGIPLALVNSLAEASIQEPLLRLALLQQTGELFSMHRLLQKVMRISNLSGQTEELFLSLLLNLRDLYTLEHATNEQTTRNRLLLPHGEALLGVKFETPPLLSHRALTLIWVANEYDNRGDYGKALVLHQEAAKLGRQHWGERHEEYAGILHYLSDCLRQLGRYDEALSPAEQALAIRQEKLGNDHPHVATSLVCLGSVYNSQGKDEEAIEYFTKALKIQQEKLGHDHPAVADSLNNLGTVSFLQQKDEEAIEYFTKSLKIRQKMLGYDHPAVAFSLDNLGSAFSSQGKYEEAIEYFTKSLKIIQEKLGHDHHTVATSLFSLGIAFVYQGKYEEAIEYFTKALKIMQEKLGYDHPYVTYSLNSMGNVFTSQGKYEEAIEYFTKALKIMQEKLGNDHPAVADSLNDLGTVFASQGKYDKGIEYYTKALKIRKQMLGNDHPSTLSTKMKLEEAINAKNDVHSLITRKNHETRLQNASPQSIDLPSEKLLREPAELGKVQSRQREKKCQIM